MSETNVQVQFSADDEDLVAGTQSAAAAVTEASDEISGSLAEMAETARASSEATSRSVGEAAEESKGFLAGLTEQVKLTGESFETLHARLSIFSDAAGAFSEFVLAGLGIEQVADAVKETAETGEQLLHLSEATGISVEALSGLRLATIEAGGSFDTISSAILRLQNNMQTAIRTPTSAAAEAFQALGISTEDLATKFPTVGDAFDAVGQKLSQYSDGFDKGAIEMGIFGIRGAELIPVLNQIQSDGGLAGATVRAQALGVAFSQAAAEADENFMVAMHDAQQGLVGVRDEISQAVIPALTALISGTGETAQENYIWETAINSVLVVLRGLIGTAAIVVDSIKAIGSAAYDLGEQFGALVKATDALGDALVLNFKGAQEAAVETANIEADAANRWTTSVTGDYNNVISVLNALTQAQKNATGSAEAPDIPSLPPAPAIDTTRVPAEKNTQDQLTQIDEDAAAERKQIAELEYQNQVDVWDASVAAHKMSKAQEIEDEIAAKDTEYQAELSALQQKASLYADGTAAKAKALDDETVLELQHNDDILKLDAQLAAAQQATMEQTAEAQKEILANYTKDFQDAFQPITSAFDQTINGIIEGTENLQQGVEKALGSIILSFIDAAAKALASWTASQLGQLAATANAQAGIIAINNEGKAIQGATSLASIANAAHVAAANAYAATAGIPYIGPVLAPAAAALAYAGVMAFDVISAAGGAASIDADNTLAMLHQNEMVLPASIANPLRDSIASGGGVAGQTAGGAGAAGGDFNVTFAPVVNLPAGSSVTEINAALSQQSTAMYNYLQQNFFRNGALMLPGRGTA